jgi:hypothetical protein
MARKFVVLRSKHTISIARNYDKERIIGLGALLVEKCKHFRSNTRGPVTILAAWSGTAMASSAAPTLGRT